jgi:hypothetical protein
LQQKQIEDEEEEGQDVEDDDANGNNEDEYEQPQQQQRHEVRQKPAKKITKNILGQIRKYCFLDTVKSMEELDNIRFKVNNEN